MIAKIILTQLLFAIRYKIRLCNNFLSVVYCLTPVLSEIVWIDKLHSCVKKSVFQERLSWKKEKETFSIIVAVTVSESYIFKLPLKILS